MIAIAAAFSLMVLGLLVGLAIWAFWVNRGPATPESVRAQSPTATSILVRWAPATDGSGVDKYLIQRDGAQVGSVAGTATSFRDKALTPSTSYRYRVFAVSGTTRSDPSAPLVVSTAAPPIPGTFGGHPFTVPLSRAGAVHTGSALAHVSHCGGTSGTDVKNTLSLQVTVKSAEMDDEAWAARSWAGSMVLTSPYTLAAGSKYCPANSVTGTLTASR